MKIYTKTGDRGETGLLGGDRVSKSHNRIQLYGEVDELNAWIGVLSATNAEAISGAKKKAPGQMASGLCLYELNSTSLKPIATDRNHRHGDSANNHRNG